MKKSSELNNTVQYRIYQELYRIFNLTENFGEKRKEFLAIFPKRIDFEEEERLFAAARFYTTSYKKKDKPTSVAEFMNRYSIIDADDENNQAAFNAWAAKKNKRAHNDDDDANAEQRPFRPTTTIKISRAATLDSLVAELQQANQEITAVATTASWQKARSALYGIGMFGNKRAALMQETERLNAMAMDSQVKTAAFAQQTARLEEALGPHVDAVAVAPK